MTREEFTKRVDSLAGIERYADRRLTDSDYSIIETVYVFYPGITKNAIAELYYRFGMVLINDMLPRAEKVRDLEIQVRQVRLALEEVIRRFKAAQTGVDDD